MPIRARVMTLTAAGFVVAGLSLGSQPDTVQGQTSAPAATLYEGARLINGAGGPAIENAAFVVSGGKFTAVGRAGQVQAPAGAARVSLAGKTVMPSIVDTHIHAAAENRQALIDQLQGKAYYGVAAVLSLGTDPGDLAFQVRNEIIPERRAAAHGRPRHHVAGTRPHRRAVLDHQRGGSAEGRAGARRAQGGHRQDLGGRSRRQVQEAVARALRSGHRRSAQEQAPRHRAHLHAGRCEGAAEGGRSTPSRTA